VVALVTLEAEAKCDLEKVIDVLDYKTAGSGSRSRRGRLSVPIAGHPT
jgi:hypothetical protein